MRIELKNVEEKMQAMIEYYMDRMNGDRCNYKENKIHEVVNSVYTQTTHNADIVLVVESSWYNSGFHLNDSKMEINERTLDNLKMERDNHGVLYFGPTTK